MKKYIFLFGRDKFREGFNCTLEIPGDETLEQLGKKLASFFIDDTILLSNFFINGERYSDACLITEFDEEPINLSTDVNIDSLDLAVGDIFTLSFDFEDDLEIVIEVDSIFEQD